MKYFLRAGNILSCLQKLVNKYKFYLTHMDTNVYNKTDRYVDQYNLIICLLIFLKSVVMKLISK